MSTSLDKKVEVFTLTPDHLRLIRSMVATWDWSENGAPRLEGYGSPSHDNFYEDMGRILGIQKKDDGFRKEDETRIQKLDEEMGTVLEIMLQLADLKPGQYSYENPLRNIQEKWLKDSNDKEPYEIPRDKTIVFTVNPEHLKLLREVRIDDIGGFDRPNPGIHPKRPYGSMSGLYEVDMAEILGIPVQKVYKSDPHSPSSEPRLIAELPKEIEERLKRVHYDMLFVLQIFVKYAQIEPGTFYRKLPSYANSWERKR